MNNKNKKYVLQFKKISHNTTKYYHGVNYKDYYQIPPLCITNNCPTPEINS